MSPPATPTRSWRFPDAPRDAGEQARWDAEQRRRVDRQQGAVTSVSAADMPGPLLTGACVAGGLLVSWLEGGGS